MRSAGSFLTLIAIAPLLAAPAMPRARADVLYIGDAGSETTPSSGLMSPRVRWMPGFHQRPARTEWNGH